MVSRYPADVSKGLRTVNEHVDWNQPCSLRTRKGLLTFLFDGARPCVTMRFALGRAKANGCPLDRRARKGIDEKIV
jgi:hypothetical protein